ncbi:antirestriction protein [Legionella longbeachae]|uniref:antirestriction protein n=1 Tax=Legionella longbeachae TaxID=450 RepID=UPI001404A514|nr:antirestriction protein [Legionella longbeachae]QIN32728.1 hypothetical protein GCB94_11540 [Legionella longbeachae]
MQKNISARLVSKKHRESFLINMIGVKSFIFEKQIGQILKQFVPNYQKGLFNCFQLSNSGFYMVPISEKQCTQFRIRDNDFEGYLSVDAAGVIASLFSINIFSRKYPENKKMITSFYALESFAYEHPEAGIIFDAID